MLRIDHVWEILVTKYLVRIRTFDMYIYIYTIYVYIII